MHIRQASTSDASVLASLASPLRIRANAGRPEAHPFYISQGCRHVKDQHVYEVEP